MKFENGFFMRAFTMIELIFVLVIIGILAYVGSSFLPDNRIFEDINYMILKIKEKQKNAIGYDVSRFGENVWGVYDKSVCIDINKKSLNELAKSSNEQKIYHILSDISVDGNSTICFDSFGRPYRPSEAHLLLKKVSIKVTKDSKSKDIKLYPISGYVTILK